MEKLSGFDYAEIQFDKAARVVERGRYDELLREAASGTVDELIVLAHGWNNDITEARDLYKGLAAQLRKVHDSEVSAGLKLKSRNLALLGLLWPSKKFTESTLIPGGAAAIGSAVSDAAVTAQLEDLRGVFDAADCDDRLSQAQRLVPRLAGSPVACDQFVDALRGLLPAMTPDPEDAPRQVFVLAGREALARLAPPVLPTGTTGGAAPTGRATTTGGGTYDAATGSAVALGLPFGGLKAGAQRLLNLFTYYQMKARAGTVGTAAANVLQTLRECQYDIGIHLAGHSFGGRLVTAATVGVSTSSALRPDSVTLLQAAFSHYGFARTYDGEHDGFFRKMIGDSMVTGPILVTHSDQDLAVGLAYPLASRLAQQAASWLGDANDRYGGIGRNGAQKTPESVAALLLAPGKSYTLRPGKVHNLCADNVITGHSDIVRPEVAYAILSAIACRVEDAN